MMRSAQRITAAAEAEGQNIANAALYGNYAMSNVSVTRIYGSNLAQLHALRLKYDPNNVMGLAGGWKF